MKSVFYFVSKLKLGSRIVSQVYRKLLESFEKDR